MTQLPTKRQPGEPEISSIPTWRELADRFRDLMSDFLKEGKELERELDPKLVPALKRLRLEIDKIIAKLYESTNPRLPTPPPPRYIFHIRPWHMCTLVAHSLMRRPRTRSSPTASAVFT